MLKLRELKELAKTNAFRTDMRRVFFEAMKAGYVNSPQKRHVAELPGSKLAQYSQWPWGATDTYLVTPLGSRSGGMTTITYEEIPVWMMQYFGEYDKKAIPCLKAALREAYVKESFVGGRGPLSFEHNSLIYSNKVLHWDFCGFFSGKEEIVDTGGKPKILGWHWYQGGIMC